MRTAIWRYASIATSTLAGQPDFTNSGERIEQAVNAAQKAAAGVIKVL
jgi:hypothetical protein